MSQVAYERVTKRFGVVTAVEELTLGIESGELMVFVGPSGCGKTTSLPVPAPDRRHTITTGVSAERFWSHFTSTT